MAKLPDEGTLPSRESASVFSVPVLRKHLKGKIVVVGIGNTLRGDDGAGPELIRKLKISFSHSRPPPIYLIDAGDVPENYLQKIAGYKPDTILLVDAVDFQSPPGSITITDAGAIRNDTISTHNASLKLVMDYLKKETKADIFLLGIQPGNLAFGSGLSKPVRQAVEKIKKDFEKLGK